MNKIHLKVQLVPIINLYLEIFLFKEEKALVGEADQVANLKIIEIKIELKNFYFNIYIIKKWK